MRDELIPFLLANKFFKMVEKYETLLIRHRRECIIGIFTLEINNQFRELVILPKSLDRVLKRLPADNGGEIAMRFAVNRSLDASLQIRRPALIQPEMLPACRTDQISAPGVRELVRNDVDVFAVLGNDGGCGKSKDWVLIMISKL